MSESARTATVVPRVLVFFDYACQFCYLDWPRFKRLRAQHGVELLLVPFELRPQMPAEGVPISEVGEHSDHVKEHMERMASAAGLGLIHPALVPNTHLALALGEFARDLGPDKHEEVHEAIFSAYNARGLDVGDRAVLLEIARTHGLDEGEVTEALDEGSYDERLHQFFHLALAMGVSATPAALICNELLIGTRPYKVLEDAVQRCLVTPATVEEALAADGEQAGEDAAEGAPATLDR